MAHPYDLMATGDAVNARGGEEFGRSYLPGWYVPDIVLALCNRTEMMSKLTKLLIDDEV